MTQKIPAILRWGAHVQLTVGVSGSLVGELRISAELAIVLSGVIESK